jgi:hypothetical protein
VGKKKFTNGGIQASKDAVFDRDSKNVNSTERQNIPG